MIIKYRVYFLKRAITKNIWMWTSIMAFPMNAAEKNVLKGIIKCPLAIPASYQVKERIRDRCCTNYSPETILFHIIKNKEFSFFDKSEFWLSFQLCNLLDFIISHLFVTLFLTSNKKVLLIIEIYIMRYSSSLCFHFS